MNNTPPSTKGRRVIKINAITQAHLIKFMLAGEYTCAELAAKTGLHYVTVLQYTRELHRAGAAHICRWERDAKGRPLIKVYKIGRGKDAARGSLSRAERAQRYAAKKKGIATARMFTTSKTLDSIILFGKAAK